MARQSRNLCTTEHAEDNTEKSDIAPEEAGDDRNMDKDAQQRLLFMPLLGFLPSSAVRSPVSRTYTSSAAFYPFLPSYFLRG